MSRKDFEAIAKIIRDAGACDPTEARTVISNDLADYFASCNPRFDRVRFLEATCFKGKS